MYLGAKLAVAGGTLAYMAGLDRGAIAACSVFGAAGSAGLLALQRYTHPAPGRAEVFQAIVHHAVYNDVFTMLGGLLGNVPYACLLQAGFSRLATDTSAGLPTAAQGVFNASSADSAGLPSDLSTSLSAGLSPAALGGLATAAALPLVLISALSAGRAMRGKASCSSGMGRSFADSVSEHAATDSAQGAAAAVHSSRQGHAGSVPDDTHENTDTGTRRSLRQLHLSRRSMLRVAGMSLAGITALLVPAGVLYASGASEQALRVLILSAGQCVGNGVRESLNQLTAAGWTAVRRDGEGLAYGLSNAPPAQRLLSTVAPTVLSTLMFGASVALVHMLENVCATAVVPQGQAILLQPAAQFGARLALRSALVVPGLEMLEALSRCAGFGIYGAMAGTALEYRHRHGAGLFDAPAQFARHVRKGPCYERVAAFTSARAIDSCLVNMLNRVADLTRDLDGGQAAYWNAARIVAVLTQAGTLGRTPVVAAWVLPRRPRRARAVWPWSGKTDKHATSRVAGPGPKAAEQLSDEEFESISIDSASDSSSIEDETSSADDWHGQRSHESGSLPQYSGEESSDTYIGVSQTYL